MQLESSTSTVFGVTNKLCAISRFVLPSTASRARELVELPFDHVIVSHGEPVHDRAAFERALELPPWSGG